MNGTSVFAREIQRLEHALAVSPHDVSRWQEYDCTLELFGSDLPEIVQSARLFLRCLQGDLAEPEHLNEVVRFYLSLGQPFNAMLCRLASLSANPAQPAVYEAASQAYHEGILSPAPFRSSEPVSCTVSVVLATRDRPNLLRQAIESVLGQTYQDFELLVINDGGTDEAQAVVESFASSKIRYFYKTGGGHRSAMNLGLKAARGKYIAYLDDDDIYFPQHLETVVAAAERGRFEFVCSRNRWVVGRWDGDHWVETEDLTRQEPFSVERLHVSAVIADLTVLHTRSLAEKVGLFWEEPLRGGEWEYWVRCSHRTAIKRIDSVTAEVRVLNPSLPRNQPARAQFFTELWRVYFGSAAGETILAVAAWRNGDHEASLLHRARVSGWWPYLTGRSVDLLWSVSLSANDPGWRVALGEVAAAQPDRIGLKVVDEVRSGKFRRALARLPPSAYGHLVSRAVRDPVHALSVLSRRVVREFRRGSWRATKD